MSDPTPPPVPPVPPIPPRHRRTRAEPTRSGVERAHRDAQSRHENEVVGAGATTRLARLLAGRSTPDRSRVGSARPDAQSRHENGRSAWGWGVAGVVVTAAWAVAAVVSGDLGHIAAAGTAAAVTALWPRRDTGVESLLLSAGLLAALPAATSVLPVDGTPAIPLLVAAGLALGAATVRPEAGVLLAPALLLAVPAAGELDAPTAVAIGAGVAAVGAAWWPGRAAVPLALVAVSLAALPGARPAALLVAAAATLAAAAPEQGGRIAVLALPGAVIAAAAIAGGPVSVVRIAVSAAALGVAALGATRPADPDARPAPRHLPAAVLAAWLLLLPGTWDWAAPGARLDAYDDGAVRALAAAGVVLAAETALRHRRPVPSNDPS